jgi:hypothetical protein
MRTPLCLAVASIVLVACSAPPSSRARTHDDPGPADPAGPAPTPSPTPTGPRALDASAGAASVAGTAAEPDGAAAVAKDAGTGRDVGAERIPPDRSGAAPGGIDCKSARLCEDFESYGDGMVPAGGWAATMQRGGTLVVDGSKPFSGAKSLHITTGGGSAQAYLTGGKQALPLADNNLFGRMMIFFVEPPPVTHYSLVRGMGAASAKPWYSIGGNGSPQHMLLSYSPNDFIVPSKTPWPANRWACLQWQFDGGKNEARVWVDGQALDDMTVTKATRPSQTWTAPSFQTLMIGYANCCASDVKVQLWIDDLAVDSKAIDCPKK